MHDTDDTRTKGRHPKYPDATPAGAAVLELTDGVPPPSRMFGGLTAKLEAGGPLEHCRGALTLLLWLSREAAVPLDDIAAAVPLLAPPLRATALEWLLTVADADDHLPALPPEDDLFAGVHVPQALALATLDRVHENASMVNVAGAAAPRMNASRQRPPHPPPAAARRRPGPPDCLGRGVARRAAHRGPADRRHGADGGQGAEAPRGRPPRRARTELGAGALTERRLRRQPIPTAAATETFARER